MKKTIIVTLTLTLSLVVVTAALARGPIFDRVPSSKPESLCPNMPILGEKQYYKVQILQEAFQKGIEPLQHDLLTKRTELRILGLSPDPDSVAIKAGKKEIQDLQATLQKKAINLRFEIWKVLNPDQRAQFDSSCPATRLGSDASGREQG